MNRAKAGAGTGVAFASVALIAFLGLWEGDEQYTVYADKLAGGLPTVCRGLTRHVTDTPIVVGEKWSAERCHAEEIKAVTKVQTELIQCFSMDPPQSVFDAASSHAWNFGAPATCGSDAMKAWRQGKWVIGCKRLSHDIDGRRVWSYVRTGRVIDGKPEYRFIQGLANRRDAEAAMCAEDALLNKKSGQAAAVAVPQSAKDRPWWMGWATW